MKLAASKDRLTIAQSRKGRRPMAVGTMLRKDKEGTLFKQSGCGCAKDDGSADPRSEEDANMRRRLLRLYERRGERPDGSLKHAADFGTNKDGYKLQGKTDFQGLPVAIENRAGSVRSGTDEDGSKWRTKYKLPYGYIEGTKGADGDEVDAYVGDKKDAPNAFVVRQKKDDGSYDEDTVMLGFGSKAEAKKAILEHYDDEKYIGDVVRVSMPRLKKLVEAKGRLVKISSASEQASLNFAAGDAPHMTGGAAQHRRKRSDVPSRDVDQARPRAEERQNAQGTMLVDAFPVVEGFNDTGKTARVKSLGDARRVGEVPDSEAPQPQGRLWRGGIGGQVVAPDPQDAATTTRYEGAYTSLRDVSPAVHSDDRSTKMGCVYSTFSLLDELGKLAEVSSEQASAALRRLKDLDRDAPNVGSLGRGALVGSLVGPMATVTSRMVSKGPKAFLEPATYRDLAGSAVSGGIFGGFTPYLRHRLEHGAEEQKLREYLGEAHKGRLRGQVKKTLGV